MEYALFALFMIACIFAAIELVRLMVRYLTVWKAAPKVVVALPVRGKMEDVEYQVRGLLLKCGWENCGGKLLLVDLGADEETLDICRRLCQEDSRLELCLASQLEERLAP